MWLIGLAVVLTVILAPLAEAQPQTGKVWRIGVLMSLYPPDADAPQALRQGLRTLGYVEGQNLVIDWRYVQGRDDRLPTLAAELVRLNVDLIVTDITLATRAAMHATSTIPIVMAISADAVGGGLVANLARPGGNVTGNSVMLAETSVKRLQLLKEAEGLAGGRALGPGDAISHGDAEGDRRRRSVPTTPAPRDSREEPRRSRGCTLGNHETAC